MIKNSLVLPGVKHITLCGSTKFMDWFRFIDLWLTLNQKCVYSCPVFGHSEPEKVFINDSNPEIKEILDSVHEDKIRNSNEIVVINVGGKIGNSTQNEIRFAVDNMKASNFMFCSDGSNTELSNQLKKFIAEYDQKWFDISQYPQVAEWYLSQPKTLNQI